MHRSAFVADRLAGGKRRQTFLAPRSCSGPSQHRETAALAKVKMIFDTDVLIWSILCRATRGLPFTRIKRESLFAARTLVGK
jgi:hypothetical protein